MVKRTERGWSEHFIGAQDCTYRRNTLLERGEDRIVVSTVGGYLCNGELETIGAGGRYFETLAFKAKKVGPYFDAAFSKKLSFKSPWEICADSPEELPDDVDNQADLQHERVVAELMAMLEQSGSV